MFYSIAKVYSLAPVIWQGNMYVQFDVHMHALLLQVYSH